MSALLFSTFIYVTKQSYVEYEHLMMMMMMDINYDTAEAA